MQILPNLAIIKEGPIRTAYPSYTITEKLYHLIPNSASRLFSILFNERRRGTASESRYSLYMNINLLDFNVSVGRHKPRTIPGMSNQSYCPFCNVESLTDILATEGSIILLKNKYNVMLPSEQLVLIETDQCDSDIPEYSKEHMHRLMRFALRHWLTMTNSGDYEAVVLFKNFGPLSGGTIRHPHMQIVGFPKIQPELMYDPREFEGIRIAVQNGVEINLSTQPHVGFTEINVNLLPEAYSDKVAFAAAMEQSPAPLPLTPAIYTMADYIQGGVTFLKETHQRPSFSYNIFFYIYEGRIHVRLMPRYPTSPLFIGYNIHFTPTNREQTAAALKKRLAELQILPA